MYTRHHYEKAFWFWVVFLLVGLLVSITAAIVLGSVEIHPIHAWQIVFEKLFEGSFHAEWPAYQQTIVWEIRLPRVLLGACVGAGLAIVGAILQAIVRNPLADPYLFGVSSGASAGAVAVIIFLGSSVSSFMLPFAAFLGSLLAIAMVFTFAFKFRQLEPSQLILAGVSVSFIFSAITNFIIFSSKNRGATESAVFWMLGGLGKAEWHQLVIAFFLVGVGSIYLILYARPLNALMMGEETATTLGIDTLRLRQIMFVLCALITGVMVAFSGAIGFIGLMLPHIVRLFVGADHRKVLPLCLLLGAIFLIWVDVLARTALSPEELPVGIITAFLGAPFVLWLMHKKFQRVR